MSSADQTPRLNEPALARIIGRLQARVALLGELEALTRRRGEAIAKERFDALGRLDDARDAVVERLLATSQDLEAAAREAAGTASPEAIRLVGEPTELLGRIEEADRRDEAALKAGGERHRQEIERVSVADRAARAYQGPGRSSVVSSSHRTEHTA